MAGFGVARAGLSFGGQDGGGSSAPGASAVFRSAEQEDSAAAAAPSSQNILFDGFGAFEKILGFGATAGGTDLDGCPWRRGRGRGSGLLETKSALLPSPQWLPSTTGCCSKAWILAFRVAMSSSSSPSSLSDWLCSLLSLWRSGKPQSSALKASSNSVRYFPWLTSCLAPSGATRAAIVAKPSSRSFTRV